MSSDMATKTKIFYDIREDTIPEHQPTAETPVLPGVTGVATEALEVKSAAEERTYGMQQLEDRVTLSLQLAKYNHNVYIGFMVGVIAGTILSCALAAVTALTMPAGIAITVSFGSFLGSIAIGTAIGAIIRSVKRAKFNKTAQKNELEQLGGEIHKCPNCLGNILRGIKEARHDITEFEFVEGFIQRLDKEHVNTRMVPQKLMLQAMYDLGSLPPAATVDEGEESELEEDDETIEHNSTEPQTVPPDVLTPTTLD